MSYFKIGGAVFATLTLVVFAWASESDELRERARAIQREAALLTERGHGEEAENLNRKAIAMLEEAEHLDRNLSDHRDVEIQGGRKEKRLGEIRREAGRIERELRESSRDGHHPELGPQVPPHEGIARRLEHMRTAVDHLHQAGMHEIAEHVAERAKATERELLEHQPPHRGEPIHEIMRQLDEIRHEVGRLRDEMNQLKVSVHDNHS